MYPTLEKTIYSIQQLDIPNERKVILKPLVAYVKAKHQQNETAHLNFICTHNSRRSQFAQLWAQTAAAYYGILVKCYSGGVEVTAFNERAIASAKRSGFAIEIEENGNNPRYAISFSENHSPILQFSKLFDDEVNRVEAFAAVMTCSHADENCPFILGTEKRIGLNYEDPKAFDDTPQEAEKYDERSRQIASELFYVFGQASTS